MGYDEKSIDKLADSIGGVMSNTKIHKKLSGTLEDFISLVLSAGNPITAIKLVVDVGQLLGSIPDMIFWEKMQRFLKGAKSGKADEVNLAEKFCEDNAKYKEFTKQLIYIIDALDEDKKIDFFADLTRCYLVTGMDNHLYMKLIQILKQCTSYELEYIKSQELEGNLKEGTVLSMINVYGLVEVTDNNEFFLTGTAKALKSFCLNYSDEDKGKTLPMTYDTTDGARILGNVTEEDIDELFQRKE
ncbi:MAG: hypothetical protein R3Y47_01420 [Lachnospiraceae bacterium]